MSHLDPTTRRVSGAPTVARPGSNDAVQGHGATERTRAPGRAAGTEPAPADLYAPGTTGPDAVCRAPGAPSGAGLLAPSGKPVVKISPPAAGPDPKRVDDAVRRIRELLDESGTFGDVSHDELLAINDLLRGLNPAETRAVFDRLSPAELSAWGREMNSGAPFGAGGLEASEKSALVDLLAGRLSGDQLARFSAALGTHEDVVAIGRATARYGSVKTRVELLRALAGDAEKGSANRLETGFGVSKTTAEDPQAVAVGEILASLQGNGAAFGEAFGLLSPGQLDAVMKSAAGMSLTTMAAAGGAVSTVDFDPRLLVRVLDAAATCNDPAVKAKVFQAASRQLAAIQESGNLLVPYVDRRGDARQVLDAMTRLLRSDTNGVMRQLESQLDRDGRSLIPYTTEMVKQGRTSELGEVLLDLQLGNDRKGSAIARFEATAPGTTGSPHHVNAEALGYFVGAIHVGIAKNVTSAKEQAALLKSVFGVVASFVGMTGTPGKVIGTIGNGLAGPVLDEICKSVAAGYKDMRSALRELAYPRDGAGKLYEGPAEDSYDATVGRVIDAQG